jgi:uroporphyrinogen decarboxylase
MSMTHRERLLAAINHREPDKVPIDLGGTFFSTMTAPAYERLRLHLGLSEDVQPTVAAYRSRTVYPHETVLRRFDVDARPVVVGAPDAGGDRKISDTEYLDEYGVTWTRAHEAHYINTNGPFYHLEEPTLQDLDRVRWPDPLDAGRYRGLRERARQLHETTDFAVILAVGPGPVHQSQFMRGYGPWLEDLLLNQMFFTGLMERLAEIHAGMLERALEEAHAYVDLVALADDVGTQNGPLMRPELYRQLIKPSHRRICETVRRFSKPVLFHTCGSVYALIPDFIEAGVDILNPIQVRAADMETQRLKREFGRELAFWGGIDIQEVLPRGTPAQVRDEVRRLIDDLGPGGGYVISAAHNIQPEVPPENLVTMYEAAREYGG